MELNIKQDLVLKDGVAIMNGVSAMNHLTFAGWPQHQFNVYRYTVELNICCHAIEEIEAVTELCNRYLGPDWTVDVLAFANETTPYWWVKYHYSKNSAC